ncbi:RHS repeat domain-containing protein [Pseudoxanthomonas winnipegensis]|uniref:RHS repeat domain-containing protein n=1 Tax=Pseudoxanthomonas winnipegensis TaxID=2480810 RepID=UPI003CE59D81
MNSNSTGSFARIRWGANRLLWFMFALWCACVGVPAYAQTVEYIHTDALGSPIAVTNASQQVIERSEYAPYGDLLNRPDTDGPGYTGHVLDAATGMNYMQQRYYDPMIGLFLSVDPVTAYAKPGVNFNRYWYASNNPYRFTDPDGRYVCSGSKTDCGNFDKAIDAAKAASTSSKLTEGQRGQLSAAVNFFGEKGNSDIKVSFGDLKGDYGLINTNREGKGTVKFDLTAIGKKSPGESGLISGLAMRALHEGDHGVRIVQEGFPGSKLERFGREQAAYRSEAYFQKATGFLQNANNLWAPWNPGDGINENAVDARANFSVMSSCAGSSEGSCL